MGKRGPAGTPREDVTLAFMLATTRQTVHEPDLGPCAIWMGSYDLNGFPILRINSVPKVDQYAHRIVYALITTGQISIPDQLGAVKRSCNVRGCIDPGHIYLKKHGTKRRRTGG